MANYRFQQVTLEIERDGGPYGTIFATFSCHQRQKCSVSCNACEKRFSTGSRNLPHSAKAARLMRVILFKSQASIFISLYVEQHRFVWPKNMNLRPPWTVVITRNSFAPVFTYARTGLKLKTFRGSASPDRETLFLAPYEPAQDAHAQPDPSQSRATHFPSFFSRT